MRLLKEMSPPEREKVQAKIETGTLTLNHLAQVQSVARAEQWSLEAKREMLQSVEGKSVRQCEKILASQMTSPLLPHETIRPLSATQSRVTFVLDEETLQLLERFKELTAHRNPGATSAGAIRLALQIAVERVNPEREVRGKGSVTSEWALRPNVKPEESMRQEEPTKSEWSKRAEADTGASQSVPAQKAAVGHRDSTRHSSRNPSRSIRRSVWRRDRTCQYVDPLTGRHCNSRFKLELDHHVPFSRGGKTTTENLRLLCRAHNAYFGGRIKPGR